MRALSSASPRVRIEELGSSYEGRRLLIAIVGSPANLARLEAIERNLARVAAGQTAPPAVLHGDQE